MKIVSLLKSSGLTCTNALQDPATSLVGVVTGATENISDHAQHHCWVGVKLSTREGTKTLLFSKWLSFSLVMI